MKMLWYSVISVAFFMMLIWSRIASSSSCQVYPSEYAYRNDSVARIESASANCRSYPAGLEAPPGVHTDHYTHCDGNQAKLNDSAIGQEQYHPSDYYVWNDERNWQLLFIFPTRVSLTTITLHYYSDSDRGLPRLRFYPVPDDFNVWDAPASSTPYTGVPSAPPGGEPTGRRNVNISVNFNTQKVLMYKFSNTFQLAVSEVEFFTCSEIISIDPGRTTTTSSTTGVFTMEGVTPSHYPLDTVPPIQEKDIEATINTATTTTDTCTSVSLSEIIAWVLASTLTVLLTGILSFNVIVLWLYKKRHCQRRAAESGRRKYEMEGNPCYETTAAAKQTTEMHHYESIREAREEKINSQDI